MVIVRIMKHATSHYPKVVINTNASCICVYYNFCCIMQHGNPLQLYFYFNIDDNVEHTRHT